MASHDKWQDCQIAGNILSFLLPLIDGDILCRTPGKLGKMLRATGQGMVKT
jgi:hypothetical protein